MNSQNNHTEQVERQQHFAIRKLTIGAASVLLGTTLWMSTNANTAKADTVDDNQDNAGQEAKTAVSTNASNAKKVVVIASQNNKAQTSEDTQKQVTTPSENAQVPEQGNSEKLSESQQTNSDVQTVNTNKDEKVKVATEVANESDSNINKHIEGNKSVADASKSVNVNQININQVANNTQVETTPATTQTSAESNQNNSSVKLAASTKQALQSAAEIQVQNAKLNTPSQSINSDSLTNSLNSVQQSAKQDKSETSTQDFDLSKVALQGVKNGTNSDFKTNLVNVGNVKLQTSINNTLQANQIDEKNAKKIAQLYGTNKTVASSDEVQTQLKNFEMPSMTQAQMQQVIAQIGSVISDPNVQNMAKDMIRGNWNGVLKESEAAGQKLVANLGGIQGIIQNVTGKLAGSDWQKELKKFNIPTMTQAQMQQVIAQIGSVISDPNVQNMAKDMIRGNWNGVLKESEAVGQKLVANLGGIQGIIQKVTASISQHSGTSWLDKFKNIIPDFANSQKVVAQKLINNIKNTNVKALVTDVVNGQAGKLLLDVIHYGTSSLKTAYAKAQEIIKQVQEGVQKQVATIKTDLTNFNHKIGLQLPKLSWNSITIKVPKLQLPKFHFNLFAF